MRVIRFALKIGKPIVPIVLVNVFNLLISAIPDNDRQVLIHLLHHPNRKKSPFISVNLYPIFRFHFSSSFGVKLGQLRFNVLNLLLHLSKLP